MRRGFTLVELMVTIGIFVVIATLTSVNFFSTYAQSTLGATEDVLIADLKTAQANAMSGQSQNGVAVPGWGIKVTGPSQYVLFPGTTYDPSNSGNRATTLPSGVTIATTFPSGQVAFTHASGEVTSFVTLQNTFTVSGDISSKVVTLNQYGTIIGE